MDSLWASCTTNPSERQHSWGGRSGEAAVSHLGTWNSLTHPDLTWWPQSLFSRTNGQHLLWAAFANGNWLYWSHTFQDLFTSFKNSKVQNLELRRDFALVCMEMAKEGSFIYLLTFYFILEYSWLTMLWQFQVESGEWKVVADTWKDAGILGLRGRRIQSRAREETRLNRSELLCNKVLFKYKGDRASFWHRHQKGAERVPPC